MSKLDVALVLESVDRELAGWQTVVIDVHRASTTIVSALMHQVPHLIPVASLEEARELATGVASPHYVGGERNRVKPAGFDFGNSPLEYAAIAESRPIIYTTTNGTRALRRVAASSRVLVGSMLNAKSVARALLECEDPILLVCSGTKGEVAAEDVFCAGLIIDSLLKLRPTNLTDAAKVAHGSYLSIQDNLSDALSNTCSGRALISEGYQADVLYCSQANITDIVPQYVAGKVSLYRGE